MAVDHIRYDILTQEALRGVVRTVLADAAKQGLPGDHHFYISFDPRHEGVSLSPRMRSQYPQEMTVVLQHQFWDLAVSEERFEVGVSFGGVPERIVVPFAAITSFADPSVQFGVQFQQIEGEGETAVDAKAAAGPAKSDAERSPRQPAEHKHGAIELATPANPEGTANEKPDTNSGEVVQLDRFRKK